MPGVDGSELYDRKNAWQEERTRVKCAREMKRRLKMADKAPENIMDLRKKREEREKKLKERDNIPLQPIRPKQKISPKTGPYPRLPRSLDLDLPKTWTV